MTSTTLYYEVHGEQGPFILFVHGMLSNRSHWRPNVPAFVAAGYRPVVVELLGHGRSPAPDAPEEYTPARYVERFEQIREAIGARQWYVIGQSLGGALTLRYALDHPERVTAHVFTNATAALAEPERMTALGSYMREQGENAIREGHPFISEHRMNPARARSLPEDLRAALAADGAAHTPLGIGMTFQQTIPGSSVRQRLHENAVPTLLALGTREAPFAPLADWAAAAVPHLSVAQIDAGHAVNLHRPTEFNTAALGFFARHQPPRIMPTGENIPEGDDAAVR